MVKAHFGIDVDVGSNPEDFDRLMAVLFDRFEETLLEFSADEGVSYRIELTGDDMS